MFDYFKGRDIFMAIVQYTLLGIVFMYTLLLSIVPLFLLRLIESKVLGYSIYAAFIILVIILSYLVNKISIRESMKYSLTNTVLVKRKSRVKNNQISNPSWILRKLYGKDTFQNKLLTKDLITVYRRSKSELITMLSYGIISAVYSFMLIVGAFEEEVADYLIVADNVLLTILISFLIMNLYQNKKYTWYSNEGPNLLMYSKMGIDKYQLFKEKRKLNLVLLSPMVLFYMGASVVFLFTFDLDIIIHALLRLPIIYMFITLVVDYSLLADVFNPRENSYSSGMGGFNLSILIFMFQGVGFTFLMSVLGAKSNILELIIIGVYVIVLVTLKLKYHVKSKKLIGVFEGSKVYG